MERSFEEAFKIPFFAIKITKALSERNKKWLLRFVFFYSLYTCIFCLFLNNVMIAIKKGNISDACKLGIYSIMYVVVTTDIITINVHYKTFKTLLMKIKQDFKADNLTMEEKKIFENYLDKSRKLCLYWSILAFGGLITIVAEHLILELYNLLIGRFVLLEIYPLSYPFINENNSPKILLFILTYLAIMYFVGYTTITFISFAPFGPVCILHSIGLLEIAEKRLENLFDEENNEKLQLKLIGILQILQHVYDIVEDMNTVYSVFYEFLLKGVAVIMPIGWWIQSKVIHQGIFEILGIIIRTLVVTAGHCYYSNKLQDKGIDIALAIYSCGWEKNYDRNTRKAILIMMTRAQRPVAIRSLFHVLSLETLSAILRQSYAILNVMSATDKPK